MSDHVFGFTHCAPPIFGHQTYCYLSVDIPGLRFHDPKHVTCPICRETAKSRESFWSSRAWLSAREHERRSQKRKGEP